MSNQTYFELIELIYAAGAEPACWPDLCRKLDAVFDANTVNLVLASEGNPKLFTSFATGATEADTRYYEQSVFAVDETVLWADTLAGESVHVYPELINGTPYAELEATKLFYERMDWWKTVIVKFVSSGGNSAVLAISRGKSGSDYSAEEIALLDSLISHLKRAFFLNDRLSRSQMSTRLAMDALNAIDAAIVVLDEESVVQLKNHKADAGLGNSFTQGPGGKLALPDEKANSALYKEIGRLQQSANDSSESMGSSIPYVVGKRAYIAYCVPYYRPDEALLWVNGYMGATIFIFEPQDRNAIPLHILVESYGLTETEAHVLQLMVSNQSTAQVAKHLEVSADAVRFHLKNMFQKTGTSRQSELIALVHGTVGKLLFDYR